MFVHVNVDVLHWTGSCTSFCCQDLCYCVSDDSFRTTAFLLFCEPPSLSTERIPASGFSSRHHPLDPNSLRRVRNPQLPPPRSSFHRALPHFFTCFVQPSSTFVIFSPKTQKSWKNFVWISPEAPLVNVCFRSIRQNWSASRSCVRWLFATPCPGFLAGLSKKRPVFATSMPRFVFEHRKLLASSFTTCIFRKGHDADRIILWAEHEMNQFGSLQLAFFFFNEDPILCTPRQRRIHVDSDLQAPQVELYSSYHSRTASLRCRPDAVGTSSSVLCHFGPLPFLRSIAHQRATITALLTERKGVRRKKKRFKNSDQSPGQGTQSGRKREQEHTQSPRNHTLRHPEQNLFHVITMISIETRAGIKTHAFTVFRDPFSSSLNLPFSHS